MPDREKVIKEFELFIKEFHPACTSEGVELDMLREVLALLKEQETTDTNDLRVFHCKKCGYGIDDIFILDEHNYSIIPKFCPNCGRKVSEANV